LLPLLLGLGKLVDVEVGPERGDEDEESENPPQAHRDFRRHQTVMPVAIRSCGTISTEREKTWSVCTAVSSARDARTLRLRMETTPSCPTSHPTAFRKRSLLRRDCDSSGLSANITEPNTPRRACSGADLPSAAGGSATPRSLSFAVTATATLSGPFLSWSSRVAVPLEDTSSTLVSAPLDLLVLTSVVASRPFFPVASGSTVRVCG